MNINKELCKLEGQQRVELEEWIAEHIYKLVKINNNSKLNYVPFVERKQVVWEDFGINIGQELNYSHLAVVLYSKANGGTALIAPLTSKKMNAMKLLI